MAHSHNGILFGLERKAILAAATTWMKPEGIVLSEPSQPQEDTDCDFAPPKYLEKSSSRRQEVGWRVLGNEEALNGGSFSLERGDVLEADGGDGCTQCECPQHPRTAHLKIVQVAQFYTV